MKNRHFSKQTGIGLIEVLVALLVVSLGLLGMAKFEASLLNASGNNKARAEAVGIAQQQMELIRYAASDTTDFEAVTDATITVSGTNADFTVTTQTEDPTLSTIINVVVNVAWVAATGDAENVTLMSEVSLQDVQKSAFSTNDSSNTVAVPSPRQSASEDVQPASETIDPNDVISPTETPLPATGEVGATVDGDGNEVLDPSFTVNSTDETPVPYTLTAIADDSRYYNTSFGDGVLGVYICDGELTGGTINCRYIQNHFGGVSLSTSGMIYSADNKDNDLSDTNPVWSSSEVTACYDGPVSQHGSGNDVVYSKPYECVYAGNCADDETKCQQGVTADQVNAKGVGPGGEFGNLGLTNLDGGNGGDQVCFLEDTPFYDDVDKGGTLYEENILNGNYDDGPSNTQNNEDYLFAGTTRSYVTRRMMSNGEERSEGINKSYRNHNFLLTNRANSPNAYKNCYNTVNADATTLSTYVLAPKNVVRVLGSAGINVVGAETTFAGVMPAITIRSTYSGEAPNLYTNEEGACYFDRDVADTEYACVVPNVADGTSFTIYASTSAVPTPTSDDPAVPTNYHTCSFSIDTTEAFNMDTATDGTPCKWGTGDFSAP